MDDEKRNGPEFAPLRDFVKSFKFRVEVYDKDDKVVRSEVMDYGNKDDKAWLGRLSFWSWTNGYTVETSKYEDE